MAEKGKPKFLKRVKVGVAVGALTTAGALALESNVKDAWHASRATQRQVATELNKTYDGQRTFSDRLLGRNKAPRVSVGKTILTHRNAKGRITSVGKAAVIKGMPKHFQARPKLPLSTRTGKMVLYGAAGGAALGAGSYVKARLRRKQRR